MVIVESSLEASSWCFDFWLYGLVFAQVAVLGWATLVVDNGQALEEDGDGCSVKRLYSPKVQIHHMPAGYVNEAVAKLLAGSQEFKFKGPTDSVMSRTHGIFINHADIRLNNVDLHMADADFQMGPKENMGSQSLGYKVDGSDGLIITGKENTILLEES
ncbi:hypothetical protein GH714_016422 [Hevea brasiliensis]|uniref:Uncharacterized protein n=1 Tax=Hevea brasiliensis TaxID=3981 RepID=A0A6A6KWV9_HEVBR|nr:hypothetical protein GH714_024566 [Hevea brasiliensis]KAF2306320.1 hypothetical protein GH714_016422 [Hevea brasiliensis]